MNTSDPLKDDRADEMAGLRRALDASVPCPPLSELTRERLCVAAQTARRHRFQIRFASAAALTLLLSSLPFLLQNATSTVPLYAEMHPLVQDRLLTELDLLDLQLLELTHPSWNDSLFPPLEERL